MRRLAVLIVLGALAGMALPSSSAGSAGIVRDCNHKLDFNLKITSARNMRCRAARRVLRRHEGSIARHFSTPDGFHCDLVEGRLISGIWRCTRGAKAFRFDFAD
jgi:hypothetical protein